MNQSVYQFNDAREYLSSVYSKMKSKNPNFSLRAMARLLGYKTPSYLADVLRGERKFGLELSKRVGQIQKLEGDQKRYFDLLVLRANAKTIPERELYFELMQKLQPNRESFDLEIDQFRLIADWYHLVILEMIDLPTFEFNCKKIARQLGDEISADQVKIAIDRLIRLGLVEQENDALKKVDPQYLTIGKSNESSVEAIKNHHQQFASKATRALDDQSVAERNFSGSTIAIAKKDLPKLNELIRKFHSDIHKILETDNPDSIYRVNLQIYSLLKANNSKEGEEK